MGMAAFYHQTKRPMRITSGGDEEAELIVIARSAVCDEAISLDGREIASPLRGSQ
jgi:hypothetical protein